MSPILVQLLRRLAVGSLVLAGLLVVAPRLLTELGWWGPTTEGTLNSAAAALEAARVYGATDAIPAYVAASRELAAARGLAGKGARREARHAAARASAQAVVAQREALLLRDAQRRTADTVVQEADRRLNELEKLYAHVAKGFGKTELADLLSLMKGARQAGAGLLLAFEQDDFAKVLADQTAAFAILDGARERLGKAGTR